MIKKMLATLLAMATVFSMTACGGGKQEAPAAKNPPAQESAEKDTSAASKFSEKYTWSLVTTYATNTPVVNGYFLFAEKLSEYTDGAVTLNVFPNGQLMNENDSFLGLKSGDVEFAGYGPTPYNLFVPEYGFVFAPFLIPDYESFQKLYSSDLLEESKKILRTKHNTRDLAGMAYRGYRNMSSNKPIKSVEDLKNLKLRMNDNILWSDTWNSMGAISIPISLGELYTSIQNGAVEASEGPWEQIAGIHLEEVQKYAVLTKHYSEIAGIWMANDLYESLPENY
ncbi:MAG: TRAP transporter substrate-binding protein, partial [Clostridia bacterium]